MKRWKSVSLVEIGQLLDARCQAGTIEAGCVHADLCDRYGSENVKHRMGCGWYKLVLAEGGAS